MLGTRANKKKRASEGLKPKKKKFLAHQTERKELTEKPCSATPQAQKPSRPPKRRVEGFEEKEIRERQRRRISQ